MYLLYVDEAGDPGLTAKASRHYLLSGIAMFEGAWRKLTTAVNQIQDVHFPEAATRVEFHFKHLHHRRGIFSHLTDSQMKELLGSLTDLWRKHRVDFTSFCVVVDKHTSGKLDNTLENVLFEQLSSRFNLFLKRKWAEGSSHKGIIVFDRRTTTQDKILQRLQTKFQVSGTKWAYIDNIIESVFTLGSDDSRILQLADFLSGAVFQAVENRDGSYLKPLAPYFDSEIQDDMKSVKVHGFKYIGKDVETRRILVELGLL